MKKRTNKINKLVPLSGIKDIIAESYLLRRSFVSDDTKRALNNLAKYTQIQFIDHMFKTGTGCNGWIIPKKWAVIDAKICREGKLIYDGMKHPLGVIIQSDSFQGKIPLERLKDHLHFATNRPHAVPFHFRMSYRAWENDWGFCLPKVLYDKLRPGEYEVDLRTKLTDGEMIVREFVLPGKSKDTVVFVAHIDHPGLSNDDLAGCAVGIKLIEKISEKFNNRYYTYKLLLLPEIVGSVFYLNKLTEKQRREIKYGIFLEMLGNNNILNLQQSLWGNTYIDIVCKLALKHINKKTRISDFRKSAGNDEIAFEAADIEIPMPSISRWPYDEYHTSDDNLEIISEEKLQESLKYLLDVVFILENDAFVQRKFTGLVSLANPKYDLYIDPGQVIKKTLSENSKKTNFQYRMPVYLNGKNKITDLAVEFSLNFRWLLQYFHKMRDLGLVSLNK